MNGDTSKGCLIYLSTVVKLVQLRYSLAVPWFLCRVFFTKRPVDVQRLFITTNMKTGCDGSKIVNLFVLVNLRKTYCRVMVLSFAFGEREIGPLPK